MSGGTLGGYPGRGDGRGREFPRVSILPGIFDGRERAREAQGCRVMGGDDISHDHDTPGSPDQRGNHPITRGDPCEHGCRAFPKRKVPSVRSTRARELACSLRPQAKIGRCSLNSRPFEAAFSGIEHV